MAPLLSHDEMHRAAPTISACSRLLGGVAICHARLNIRSGSEDIMGTENRSIAILDKRGYCRQSETVTGTVFLDIVSVLPYPSCPLPSAAFFFV
ncbi:hypothetical protein FOVG_19219 [Fusarium oxysporum f. sp. pisi HDV247]|uniref:Uncharacterized protein n=1 Tax=Fusarium oxysporum f. sp. pisi HDV247 TaxID=1080344 RepID=W9NEX4_FUSOX|nr:hypothetical protein FOVG_19219 [Fusarium oxysporum f. sp. pisi HDV247]